MDVKSGCPDPKVRRYTTNRVNIVVMVGGCTWDQVAAIRRANQANAANGKPLVIITTAVIGKEELMRSFEASWVDAS